MSVVSALCFYFVWTVWAQGCDCAGNEYFQPIWVPNESHVRHIDTCLEMEYDVSILSLEIVSNPTKLDSSCELCVIKAGKMYKYGRMKGFVENVSTKRHV